MKQVIAVVLLFLVIASGISAVPNINSIIDNGPVGKYEKFEATYGLGETYTNPYDPAEIDVNVLFTSPTGKTYTANGFIYQAFIRGGDVTGQILTASGELVWKVRFAPDETGVWNYEISAYDGVTATAAARQFTVNASVKKGFIKKSSKDSNYFAFDNGSAYFPAGESMGWAGAGRTHEYDVWVSALAAAGGNYIRVWNAPWNTEVEWADSYPTNPVLPGNYSARQAEAWELDHILDLAESNNIGVLLTLLNHGKFSSGVNPNWNSNPYNSIVNPNGLISTPQEVWTNTQVRAYMKRLWRYYISRYAYSTALFSWEFWNEMEWTDDYANQVSNSAAWHQDAGNYFRLKDPHKHLITTSYAYALNYPSSVWDAGMDFTQNHNYGGTDFAAYIHSVTALMKQQNPAKPYMQEEMGLSTTGSGADLDPTGLSIHEANWSALMSGGGGGAIPWWWDSWIHPSNLYYRWTGIANFLSGEELDNFSYTPATVQVSTVQLADYLVSPGFSSWATPAPSNSFTVSADGSLIPSEINLGNLLYGSWYAAAANPPTFHVNYAAPGKFRVTDIEEYPDSNCSSNSLRIELDGTPVLTQNPTCMGAVYEIDVPIGDHDIFVTNTGGDWIKVSYTFTNYTKLLRCYALSGDDKMLGWVQSRNYTYWQQHNGVTLTAVNDGVMNFTGVPDDGTWRFYWWNTLTGAQDGPVSDFTASGGSMNVSVPSLTKDAAFKAYYIGVVVGSPTMTPTITMTKTITPTQTITPTPTRALDLSLYPFEDGTIMGWVNYSGEVSNPVNAADKHYLGARSLKVTCVFDDASTDDGGTISVMSPPVSDITGKVIIAHVYAPLGTPAGTYAQVYIQSGTGWVWENSAGVQLAAGAWSDIYFDVNNPAYTGSGTPDYANVRSIGVKIGPPGGLAGTLTLNMYIDSVDVLNALPAATPTITPTSGSASVDLDSAHVYPSLADMRLGQNKITFTGLTQKCSIKVFRVDGTLAFSQAVDSADGIYVWDMKANIGPGLYIYILNDLNGTIKRGKLAIIR